MSQTTSADPSPSTFDQSTYLFFDHVFQEHFATIGLHVGLYGVLLVLTAISIYALVNQCTRNTQLTTIALSLTIFTLFTSTTMYTVTSILSVQTFALFDFIMGGFYLWPNSNINPYNAPSFVEDYTQLHDCSGTAALTLNIALGDAIVCWRACVVWHGSRTVRVLCAVFVLATFALGVVDTKRSCNTSPPLIEAEESYIVGFMYEGIPVGIATCVLSLTTNLMATGLVGVKAWESRKRLRGYLVAGPRAAQVKKLFALLIESGALYSAFWVVILGFQVGQYQYIQTASLHYREGFFDIISVVINGCLVPLIAIYPTIVIVLVALNRSHIERGLSQHGQSLPTLHLSLVGDPISNC